MTQNIRTQINMTQNIRTQISMTQDIRTQINMTQNIAEPKMLCIVEIDTCVRFTWSKMIQRCGLFSNKRNTGRNLD